MNSMTAPPARTGASVLTASLASLVLGVALTLGIVVGTHRFEHVRIIEVQADVPAGYQLPRTDEEKYYRQLSAFQQNLVTDGNLPRADEEKYYRQPTVVQSTTSANNQLPRADEESYYRITDWNGPPLFEQARRADSQ